MRARALLPTLTIATLAAIAVPGVALADDTTPPVGTLEVEGGRGLTTDGTVVLDVPATDDVGVTTLVVRDIHGDWIDYPYTPQVIWTFDPAQVGEQQLTVMVGWRDAAGNASFAEETFWYDAVPPDLRIFKTTTSYEGPPGTIVFYVGAYEEASGVAAVRFSTDNGAHWGAEIPMTDQIVVWDPRDPAVGGNPKGLGEVKVLAKVRDGSGQWSNVRSTPVQYMTSVHVSVSSNPTTGQPVTFTPEWSAPVTIPAGSQCMWEFMTGNDTALFHGDHDESFSYTMTEGAVSAGACGPWTFTLPWSPVRRYLVAFTVLPPDGPGIDAQLGSPGEPAFSSTVGSTSRAITTSNLPLFYVLPDDDNLTVGVPTTYRGFAIGGAKIKSSDRWSVVENGPHFYPGASSFTFTPQKAGHVTVCLMRGSGSAPKNQLGACFDPRVRKAAGGGATTPPTAGTPGSSAAPVSSAAPTAAAPTEIAAASGAPTTEPSQGAVAVAAPGITDGPVAAPTVGATSGSSDPGPVWVALLVAAVLLAGGAAMLMRPDIRARVRSRLLR